MRLSRSRGFIIATVPILTFVMIACATGTDSIDLGEGGITDEASVGRDVIVIPANDSSTGDTGPKPPDSGPCDRKVVINEVQVDGTSEWVEIYNASTCAVTVGGWRLAYRSSSDAPGGASYSFGTAESLAPKQFFLIATAAFVGKKDATFNGGFGNSGGQVGLLDDTMKLVDAVGYDTGTSGMYTEGQPTVLPGSGKSVGRSSDGVDTNNNKNDFKLFNTPTPGAGN